MADLHIRIDFSPELSIGPGKVRLLELVSETGSISAAGRALNMSYRKAWLLVDELNRMFKEPVVTTQHGGAAGGGAMLTEFGARVIAEYRAIQHKAQNAAARNLDQLCGFSRGPHATEKRRK
jgi:molybdate transport system regulatory protein